MSTISPRLRRRRDVGLIIVVVVVVTVYVMHLVLQYERRCDACWNGLRTSFVCASDCSQLNGDCRSQCLADPFVVTLNCSCLPGYHISVKEATCVGEDSYYINFPNSTLIARKCLPQGTLINGGQLLRVIYADTVPNGGKCQLFVQKNYVTESNLGSISRFQCVSCLPNPLLLTQSRDCKCCY